MVLLATVGTVIALSTDSAPQDVAAAAYAAAAMNSGVVYASFDTHAARSQATVHQEQWVDASEHSEREVTMFGSHRSERVSVAGRTESWSSDRPGTIILEPRGNPQLGVAFGGLSLYGLRSVALYRELYHAHRIVLAGHTRRFGQDLWRLQTKGTSFAGTKARLVVLVSPKTFLPVLQSVEDLKDTAHPTPLSESHVTSYQHRAGHLPAQSLSLRLKHPGARVERKAGPIFRSGSAARKAGPGR
jgi:hypothetical protein